MCNLQSGDRVLVHGAFARFLYFYSLRYVCAHRRKNGIIVGSYARRPRDSAGMFAVARYESTGEKTICARNQMMPTVTTEIIHAVRSGDR